MFPLYKISLDHGPDASWHARSPLMSHGILSQQTDDTGVNIYRSPEAWSIQRNPRSCIDLAKIVRLTKIRHSKIGQGQGRQHRHEGGSFRGQPDHRGSFKLPSCRGSTVDNPRIGPLWGATQFL